MEVIEKRPEILSVVEKVALQQKIENYKITDVKVNAKGEGYLGEIFFVTIEDPFNNNRTLQIVIKAAFTNEKIREMASIRASFENEILYYTAIYPAFEEFWQNRTAKGDLNFAPACLYSDLDHQPEVLVLENLKNTGFEIFDKKRTFDREHAILIFRNYGRYHALSMAMRDQNPEQYQGFTDKMHNLFSGFVEKKSTLEYFLGTAKKVQKLLQPGQDDHLLEEFEKYTIGESYAEMWTKAVDSNCDYSAILHGDCWSNNMMFKYEDSKPVEMRLIDFQLIKIGNPICDLSYFFYSGTSIEGLQNFNEYLEEYHKSFSATARQLGSDPETIFPFDALKNGWKRFAKFGFIFTFDILRIKMTEKGEAIDLTDALLAADEETFGESFKNVKFNEKEYNERIRANIQHMYDLKAL